MKKKNSRYNEASFYEEKNEIDDTIITNRKFIDLKLSNISELISFEDCIFPRMIYKSSFRFCLIPEYLFPSLGILLPMPATHQCLYARWRLNK